MDLFSFKNREINSNVWEFWNRPRCNLTIDRTDQSSSGKVLSTTCNYGITLPLSYSSTLHVQGLGTNGYLCEL